MVINKKIRIVHVVYSFGTGGMEKGICTTIKHGSGDFEHIVLCLTSAGEMAQYLPCGTKVIALGKRPGNSLNFILKLRKILKQLEPAIIHTRNWSGMDGILAARLAGISMVVHGEHGWGMDDPFGLNMKRRLIRRILGVGVCQYTCVSNQIKDWLEKDIKVRKPVTQIYNGVDTAKFRPATNDERAALRKKFHFSFDTQIIGIVARLDPIKNHHHLIKAFANIRNNFPKAQLIIVGDGTERKKMEALAGPGVHFFGNRNDVEQIYRILDLFVLPSKNEGISNTILEAMASGLPIIAGNVGGNPELLTHGYDGSLIQHATSIEIERAISLLLYDQAVALNMGHNALQTVKGRFSINKMVSSYERLWRTIWSMY